MVTVVIMTSANCFGWSVLYPNTTCSATETTAAEIMAATSLQALIRHQYQRSSKTIVVMVTVVIMTSANCFGWSVLYPNTTCSATETTAAEIMAATSLQALIRHQYQRSSKTPPVPAPVTMSTFHAPPMESIWVVTSAEMRVRSTVATCDART